MPKVNANNRINGFQSYGTLVQHAQWINQAVTSFSSPTFGNLSITGDAQIGGNLYVYGNTSIFGTNIIEFEDNILVINRAETSPGVTLGLAGLEVNRGSGEAYRMVFRENDDTFRVGFASSTQAVTTREDAPLNGGVMMWNDSLKRADSRNTIDLSIGFRNTENAVSSSTGSIRLSGGAAVSRDIFLGGKLNFGGNSSVEWSSVGSLSLSSSSRIDLFPTGDITIPYSKNLVFGTTGNRLIVDPSNNITVSANGAISLIPGVGRKVAIPNLIPLVFSTDLEKIYADDNNNLVAESSLDIRLNPTRQVLLQVDKPIAFGNGNQKIFANGIDDLSLNAANNIQINPGPNLDAVVRTNSGMRWSPNTRVWGDVSDNLFLRGTAFYLTGGSFRLTNSTPIHMGPLTMTYSTTGSGVGTLVLNGGISAPRGAFGDVTFTNLTTGNFVANGVATINGNTTINGNLQVNGTTTTFNTEVQIIKDNLLVLNSGPESLADAGILMKRFSDGVSSTVGNIYAGIFYREASDEITLGYTASDPGAGAVTITDYTPLRSDRITIVNSTEVTGLNGTGASLYTLGGAHISKSLYVERHILLGEDNSSVQLTNSRGMYSDGIGDMTLVGNKVSMSDNLVVGLDTTVGGSMVVDGNLTIKSTTGSSFLGDLILSKSGDANYIRSSRVNGSFNKIAFLPYGTGTSGEIFSVELSGIRVGDNKSLDFGNYQLLSSGGTLNLTSSLTSGTIQLTTDLDVVGKSTLADDLEIVDGEVILSSSLNAGVFRLQPTTGLLRLTTDTLSNGDKLSLNMGLRTSNLSGTSYVDFTPGASISNLVVTSNVQTSLGGTAQIDGETRILNKKTFTISNTGGNAGWYRLDGLVSDDVSLNIDNGVFSYRNLSHSLRKGGDSFRLRIVNDSGRKHYLQIGSMSGRRHIEVYSSESSIISPIAVGSSLPSGTVIYDTGISLPNDNLQLGDIISYGNDCKIASRKTVFGYDTTTDSVSLKMERVKETTSNFTLLHVLTLPSQSGVSGSSQIKFGVTGPTDDLVDGVLEHNGQYYRIIEYDTGIKVATIDGIFLTPPSATEQVKVYGQSMVNIKFNEGNDSIDFLYTPGSESYTDIRVGSLTASKRSSLSSADIVSTEMATGSSGALVVSGGARIEENLIVGGGGVSISDSGIQLTGNLQLSGGGGSSILYSPMLTIGGLTFVSNGSVSLTTNLLSLNTTSSSTTITGGSLQMLGLLRLDPTSGNLTTEVGTKISVLNTTDSTSRTSGALVVNGGLSIVSTTNVTSSTSGGALTVGGGAGIAKDLKVGGSLTVDGTVSFSSAISFPGAVSSPVVTFNTGQFVNCNLATVVYSKLSSMSTNTFNLCVEVNPLVAYENTEINFVLPERSLNLSKRTDIVCHVSGWTDDTNLVSLFNVLGTGQVGTTNCVVKFGSVSTNTHYLQITCFYDADA